MDSVSASIVPQLEEEDKDNFLINEVGNGVAHIHEMLGKLTNGLTILLTNVLDVIDLSRTPPNTLEVGRK